MRGTGRQRQSGGGKLLLASKLQPGCAQAENTRTVVGAEQEGWRWREGNLAFSIEWEHEAKDSVRSETNRTGEELKKSMNEIFLFLNFTIELEEDFEDGYLPTLDTKHRVRVNGIITYIFYEKPTAANVS